MLTTVESFGRKVVCGTGGMVPEGMALAVGLTGGIVPVGIDASEVVPAVELFVEDGVVGAVVAAGGGETTDGWGTATCKRTATSPEAEISDGACWARRRGSVSREGWSVTSMAGGSGAGATTGAGVMLEESVEGDGLTVAGATVVGAGALAAVTVLSGAGLAADWAMAESGAVMGGTTVNDGRSGSATTTAMISSGLCPSNSAF